MSDESLITNTLLPGDSTIAPKDNYATSQDFGFEQATLDFQSVLGGEPNKHTAEFQPTAAAISSIQPDFLSAQLPAATEIPTILQDALPLADIALPDRNNNSVVDARDRRNQDYLIPDPFDVAKSILRSKYSASGSNDADHPAADIIVVGENHEYPKRADELVDALASVNSYLDRKTVVVKEIPKEYFGELFEQHSSDYPNDNTDHFALLYDKAVDTWADQTSPWLESIRTSLFGEGMQVNSMRNELHQLVDFMESGIKFYAGSSSEKGPIDQSLFDTVQRARQENPGALIIVQVGAQHAESGQVNTELPSLDEANPLGKRLKDAFGDDEVISVYTAQMNQRKDNYNHKPPFDHYDLVVGTDTPAERARQEK